MKLQKHLRSWDGGIRLHFLIFLRLSCVRNETYCRPPSRLRNYRSGGKVFCLGGRNLYRGRITTRERRKLRSNSRNLSFFILIFCVPFLEGGGVSRFVFFIYIIFFYQHFLQLKYRRREEFHQRFDIYFPERRAIRNRGKIRARGDTERVFCGNRAK